MTNPDQHLDLSNVVARLAGHVGELTAQLAMRDSMLESMQREIAQVTEQRDELQGRLDDLED